MMPRKIKDGIYWMGAVDWDRRLFDALIPLPDGTSYNAYLVQGSEKTALIDTCDPVFYETLMAQLQTVPRIDYIVANHAEQDHSGLIPKVMEKYPQAKVIASTKGRGMLADHLCIPPERIQAVADGEIVSLGNRTLQFFHMPWVHWPETMATYLQEDGILFSCDFFGSHLATSDLYVTDEARVYESAKRYYAEIMMPFRTMIHNHLERLKAVPVNLIAPSHGPVYPRPAFIMDAYRQWVDGAPRNLVVIPFITMHGSTELMVRHLIQALVERGVAVQPFNLADSDIGKLAISLVDAATLVVGTPTVHIGPHPAVFYAAHLANALRPKLKYAAIIGSYGWSSKAVDHIKELIPNLKVEILGTTLCRGYPRDTDRQALTALADTIAARHKEAGLV